MEHKIDARGKQCPIPVVMTKKLLDQVNQGDEIEILVDNEIAVQNLSRLAGNNGCSFVSQKEAEDRYRIRMAVKETAGEAKGKEAEISPECADCGPKPGGRYVVAVGSDRMGDGEEALGQVLIKGFLFALTQLEELPETVLFYNSGAKLTVEGSQSLEDLKTLEAQGTKILTCGTCLNHYGLTEKLSVGEVTNMYTIVEILTGASKIVRP